MKQLFQYYYEFMINHQTGYLQLINKYGNYAPLEENQKSITKFVINASQNLAFNHAKGNILLLNPFKIRWKAIGSVNNNQDTIFVMGDPTQGRMEFFICKNSKHIDQVIFSLLSTNQLDEEIQRVRNLATNIYRTPLINL